MRTAILGVGTIGGTLARHLVRASHDVVLVGAGPRSDPYGLDRGAPQGAWLAAQLPGARVVRAFNTLPWETLRDAAFRTGPDRVALPVSGDDPAATALVAELAAELGFAAVVVGPLSASAPQDPGGELYAVELPEERMRSLVALAASTGGT